MGGLTGTAAGRYDIRRLQNKSFMSSMKGLMKLLSVAHFGQRKKERDARSSRA
jgi:hypothetical protein